MVDIDKYITLKKKYMDNDLLEHYQPIYEKWKKSKVLKIINLEYKLGLHTSHLLDAEKTLNRMNQHRLGKLWLYLTISPPDRISFEDFKKKVEKYVARKIITDYLYVYEQRGTTMEEVGKGRHAHLLVARNLDYIPSQFLRNTKNTFKSIVNVQQRSLFYPVWQNPEYMKDKTEYLMGKKSKEGKDVKQAMDKEFREANALQNYYTNIPEYFQNLKIQK